MQNEKEYINYLIENKEINQVSDVLDKYFTDQFDFNDVIEESELFTDILSYKSWDKSNRIDQLLN